MLQLMLWIRHVAVVPCTQFSSGLEHDQLVGPDFVEIQGGLRAGSIRVEGRYVSTSLRYKSAANFLTNLESWLMSNIANCFWNLEWTDVSWRLGTSQGFDLAIWSESVPDFSWCRVTGRFGTCVYSNRMRSDKFIALSLVLVDISWICCSSSWSLLWWTWTGVSSANCFRAYLPYCGLILGFLFNLCRRGLCLLNGFMKVCFHIYRFLLVVQVFCRQIVAGMQGC